LKQKQQGALTFSSESAYIQATEEGADPPVRAAARQTVMRKRMGFDSPTFRVFSRLGGIPMAVARSAAPKSRQAQRQPGNRWTKRIADGGWTPVSNYFLANYHRLRITPTEAMVLIHLISFKWDSAAPFPALATIGKRMGLTSTSVRSHLRSLERKGYLTREMRIGHTNRFYLDRLFVELERMMEADKAHKAAKASVEPELV
jgi:hypothetical protein